MKQQNASFGIGFLLGIILTAMVFIGLGLSAKVNRANNADNSDQNFDLNHSEIPTNTQSYLQGNGCVETSLTSVTNH